MFIRRNGLKKKTENIHLLYSGKERINKAVAAIVLGILVNLALFAVKLYIGLSSNSLSVMTDAVNNLSDSLGFIIAAAGFSFLRKKAAGEMVYGYGRVEYLADFVIATVVCIVGASFLYLAVERFVLPYLLVFTWNYFAIIASTVVVKILLGLFFRFFNKRVDSGVLKGASLDSFTDAGVTTMSLIGFSLNRYANLRLDAVFGLIIGVIMLINGIKLLISAAKKILGEKISSDREREIREICLSHDEVAEIKSLSLHDYGAENKQLVLELIFTKEETFDIIDKVIGEITETLSEKFRYDTKICLSRRQNETQS